MGEKKLFGVNDVQTFLGKERPSTPPLVALRRFGWVPVVFENNAIFNFFGNNVSSLLNNSVRLEIKFSKPHFI